MLSDSLFCFIMVSIKNIKGINMSVIQEVIENSRKIVLKIGSNVLSDGGGAVDKSSIQNIVEQVKGLIEAHKQVVIVSSGAGICGVGAINKWSRRMDINYKQALCAIGQVELMMAYKEYFGSYGVHVGQLLLTREDFSDANRNLNIRNALFTLIDEGVVPVINENDSVSVDEIKIGDNDTLGALTANLWNADTLIVLSDIDGVFDCDPKTHQGAELIGEIHDIDGVIHKIDMNGTSKFGTGGIATKIEAARMVNEYGANMVLLNGCKRDIIKNAYNGLGTGTVFFAK